MTKWKATAFAFGDEPQLVGEFKTLKAAKAALEMLIGAEMEQTAKWGNDREFGHRHTVERVA